MQLAAYLLESHIMKNSKLLKNIGTRRTTCMGHDDLFLVDIYHIWREIYIIYHTWTMYHICPNRSAEDS